MVNIIKLLCDFVFFRKSIVFYKGVNCLLDTVAVNFKSILDFLSVYVPFTQPLEILRSLVDVSIVSYLTYKLIQLVKETRAWQLVKGIVVILIVAMLSDWLKLRTLAYILNRTIELAGFAW